MKRAAFSLLSLALGASAFGVWHKPIPLAAQSVAPAVESRHTAVASGSIAKLLAIVTPTVITRDDDHAEALRRLHSGAAGTYIDDILLERDSSVARWADRKGVPLTVWIQPQSSVSDFAPGLVSRVRQAFDDWDALKLPVGFAFVKDSAKAEVHVNWIDHFSEPISGRTKWSRDDDWVITDANIILAVHHSQGDVLDEASMHAMALHEIGHLLGLDHTRDSMSIMAPRVRVRQLSDADRATVRLIYALPAGPLR